MHPLCTSTWIEGCTTNLSALGRINLAVLGRTDQLGAAKDHLARGKADFCREANPVAGPNPPVRGLHRLPSVHAFGVDDDAGRTPWRVTGLGFRVRQTLSQVTLHERPTLALPLESQRLTRAFGADDNVPSQSVFGARQIECVECSACSGRKTFHASGVDDNDVALSLQILFQMLFPISVT